MNAGDLLWFHQALRRQWREPSEIIRYQNERLREIISHAYSHVPYYRELMSANAVRPEHIHTPEDLRHIPVTSRETLASVPAERITSDLVRRDNCVIRRTSGTSGTPLRIYLTWQDKERQDLILARALLACGLKLRDLRVAFAAPWEASAGSRWFRRIGVWRKVTFSVFDDLRDLFNDIERLDPQCLFGTPPALETIAREQEGRGGRLRPRIIISIADLLTMQSRRYIESAFDCPVFDFYGCVEMGYLAWQCSKGGGYHISADSVYVEILRDGKPAQPGETGKVVCTSLINRAMPFIRYDLGDLCRPLDGLCGCGRKLPLIELIEGRTNEHITLPSGRVVTPQALSILLTERASGIHQFKLIQKAAALVVLLVVKGKEAREADIIGAKKALEGLLGSGVNVVLEEVESIPPEPSGKRRYVVSEIQGVNR